MKLSISGIGPSKKRVVVSWTNGKVEGDEFLKSVYASLAANLKVRMLFHHPTVVSRDEEGALSAAGFFYISRFILKDVKILEGSVKSGDFIPEGAKA